jgi:hypothetical protein
LPDLDGIGRIDGCLPLLVTQAHLLDDVIPGDRGLSQEVLDQRDDIRVDTSWSSRCTVVCHCRMPDGRDPCIRTVWQMESDAPRLLTAIPRP